FVLFSLLSLALCALHSFPTRRSSDLHLLRRILILQMIDSIRTAEVRNITLRRHSCAAEKNDPAAVVYDLLKLFCLFLIHSFPPRSEEHTSELQSRFDLVCRLLLETRK